jgi:hypothetical protein
VELLLLPLVQVELLLLLPLVQMELLLLLPLVQVELLLLPLVQMELLLLPLVQVELLLLLLVLVRLWLHQVPQTTELRRGLRPPPQAVEPRPSVDLVSEMTWVLAQGMVCHAPFIPYHMPIHFGPPMALVGLLEAEAKSHHL